MPLLITKSTDTFLRQSTSRCLRLLLLLLAFGFFVGETHAVPSNSRQLIVAVGNDWNSSSARMFLFDREGKSWKAAAGPIPVLLGRAGMAWGIGLRGQEQPGLKKRERDGRAPAGMFAIGKIFTHDSQLPSGSDFPFHTIGPFDAWVDDVTNPLYNQHVVVDPKKVPEWFEKQRMRHGDFAYRWLVEVRHNRDQIQVGAGSAIFFHIRRGTTIPTAGCTTMAANELSNMIRWMRRDANPVYVLLPAAEYQKLWKDWGLPEPAKVGL